MRRCSPVSASLATAFLFLLHGSTAAVAEVVTTASGLKIEDTRTIKCDRPSQNGDIISVHYTGTLESGLQFDGTWARGQPFYFTLGKGEVIKGWDEGMLGMCIGTRRTLIIPPSLGYGESGTGPIPPNSVLRFETQLMAIAGVPTPAHVWVDEVKAEEPSKDSNNDTEKTTEEAASTSAALTATASAPSETAKQQAADPGGPMAADGKHRKGNGHGECHLLGPFAIIVQSALGILALTSLVFKRWRERPRRPLLIWFFDVSKQVMGTALLHVVNLVMSMLGAGVGGHTIRQQIVEAAERGDNIPNPCSFYLLNLAIDTTIGIPILVILLRVLHALFARTPLANPPESLKSGYYGSPPRAGWWIKQSFIYFLGLLGMKLFVLFLFAALPWLPWVGDWALRWTEGNESLQIAFVMFLFPLAMNALQYYIIDTFIKDKDGPQGYESVQSEERDGDGLDRDEDPFAVHSEGEGDEEDDADKDVVNGVGANGQRRKAGHGS